MTTTKPQSEETLEPCPWCPTTQRETHQTEAGTVGIIFHSEGCIFDGRQVLNPRGVKVWNTRPPASAAPVVDKTLELTTAETDVLKKLTDAVTDNALRDITLSEFETHLAVRVGVKLEDAAAAPVEQ